MTIFRGYGASTPKPNGCALCCKYSCRLRLRGVCKPIWKGSSPLILGEAGRAEVFTEDGLSNRERQMGQIKIYENAKWWWWGRERAAGSQSCRSMSQPCHGHRAQVHAKQGAVPPLQLPRVLSSAVPIRAAVMLYMQFFSLQMSLVLVL